MTFRVRDALMVPDFAQDVNTLLHEVVINDLKHFQEVEISAIPQRKSIDILFGQTDKCLKSANASAKTTLITFYQTWTHRQRWEYKRKVLLSWNHEGLNR